MKSTSLNIAYNNLFEIDNVNIGDIVFNNLSSAIIILGIIIIINLVSIILIIG